MRGLILGVALCVLALAVAWQGDATLKIAGLRPLGHARVGDLDDPPNTDESSESRLLEERDTLEIVAPRDMTAGDLLRLYQLDQFAHIQLQIATQLKIAAWSDGQSLKKGDRFRITLTDPRPPGS